MQLTVSTHKDNTRTHTQKPDQQLNFLHPSQTRQPIVSSTILSSPTSPNAFNATQISPALTVGHLAAITAMVGPPTYPAPMQQIFNSQSSLILCLLICGVWCGGGFGFMIILLRATQTNAKK
jgi:hypothetical protein